MSHVYYLMPNWNAKYPYTYSIRPRRPPPLFMHLNRLNGLCWCGKPKNLWENGMRKYCCTTHSEIWEHACAWWNMFRNQILESRAKKDPKKCCGDTIVNDNLPCPKCGGYTYFELTYVCALCGKETDRPEVDHIIAKCNDGEVWDEANLRVLCHTCHAAKTAEDMRQCSRSKKKLLPLDLWLAEGV